MPSLDLVGERPQPLRRLAATPVLANASISSGPIEVSNYGRLTAVFHQSAATAPAAGFPIVYLSVDGTAATEIFVVGTQDTTQLPEIVYTIDVALTLPFVRIEYTNGASATTLSYLVLAWPTPATTAGSGGGGGGGTFTCTLAYLGTTPLEIGTNLVNPTFNASYSGTPTMATLDDSDGNPQQNVLGLPNPLTMPFTYQKTANGGTEVFTLSSNGGSTSTQTVTWLPLVHYGVSASATLNQAQIKALAGSALASTSTISFTLTPAAQYLYYAFPTSFGAVSPLDFQTPPPFPGGWVEMAGSPIAITAATAGAPVQNYYVWRTTNPLTAAAGVDTDVT